MIEGRIVWRDHAWSWLILMRCVLWLSVASVSLGRCAFLSLILRVFLVLLSYNDVLYPTGTFL